MTNAIYDAFRAGLAGKASASMWFLESGVSLGNNPAAMEGQTLKTFREASDKATIDSRLESSTHFQKSSSSAVDNASAFFHIANGIRAYVASGANAEPNPLMTGEESLLLAITVAHRAALDMNPGTYSVSIVSTARKWATSIKTALNSVAKKTAGPEAIAERFTLDAMIEAFESDLKAIAPVAPVAPATIVEPDAVEPDAVEPDAVEPDAVEPDAVEPDAVEPDAVEPDAVEPDAVEPDAVEPDAVEPDAVEPDAVESVIVADGFGGTLKEESIGELLADMDSAIHDDESSKGNDAPMTDSEYGSVMARLAAYLVTNKISLESFEERLGQQIDAYIAASKPAPRVRKAAKTLAVELAAF